MKDLKAVISVFNTDIFSSGKINLSSSIIFVLFGTNFFYFLLMVFHSLLRVEVSHP